MFNVRPDQELPPGAEMSQPPAEIAIVSADPTITESDAGGHSAYPLLGTPERREMLIAQAIPPGEMTADEKLNEILVILREGQKLLTKYMNDMSSGGMMSILGAFMGGKK